MTAEPGLGKAAALRQITATLNPHQYQLIYIAETDFGRLGAGVGSAERGAVFNELCSMGILLA